MNAKAGFFKRLKALSLPQKKLFAIALCQRMLPNYQLFAEVCHFGNPAILETLLQLLWQSLYDPKLKLNIELQLAKLEENTPEPEDFDVYGVYPALDAVVALSSLLGALESKVEDDMINISKLSSATVANYIEAIAPDELTEQQLEDFVFEHAVMQEERQVQESLLALVEEQPQANAEFIKELRKEIATSGVSNIGISLN